MPPEFPWLRRNSKGGVASSPTARPKRAQSNWEPFLTDEKGRPVRAYQSTTYLGSFERAGDFGTTLRDEPRRRGLNRTQKIVYLGDGAAWIWELARVNFPGAVLILDVCHMMLYLRGLSRLL